MSLTIYRVPLDCGHEKTVQAKPPPGVGEELWCILCGEWRYIPFYSPQWVVKCADCTYKRRQGVVEDWARIQAKKHGYRRGHRVVIFREDTPDKQADVPRDDNPLPTPGSPHPF